MSDVKQRVVITGIACRMGRLVARRLHRTDRYQLIGIDGRSVESLPKDIEHLKVDLRSKRAREVFRGGRIDALIHLGLRQDLRGNRQAAHSWNVLGTTRLLEYCLEYGVRKVIVLSSADVYGPRPENQQFLSEDAPLLGALGTDTMRDLVEADMQATSFFWRAASQEVQTIVLRPVHILGSLHNPASNYLRLRRLPVLIGYDPMVQVIHELDVVEAICLALDASAHGVFNLAGPAELPLSALAAETGKPLLPVPAPLFRAGLAAAYRMRLTAFPAEELEHIRFVCMVDDERARRVLGYLPKRNLRECVDAALNG